MTPELESKAASIVFDLVGQPSELREAELQRLYTEDAELAIAVLVMLVCQETTIPTGAKPQQTQTDSGYVSGQMLDRFKLLHRLAAGGQGEVWLAVDPTVRRFVAIKIGLGKAVSSVFFQEARVTGRLEHPNIVPVYEVPTERQQETSGQYFVMRAYGDKAYHDALFEYFEISEHSRPSELLNSIDLFNKDKGQAARQKLESFCNSDEGKGNPRLLRKIRTLLVSDSWAGSLAQLISRLHVGNTNLELRNVLSTFHPICQATAFAHSRGVIHRDLKPENVMIGEYGEVLVADWGLAKIVDQESSQAMQPPLDPMKSVSRLIQGTIGFLSPEQASGSPHVDARSDVYSLGPSSTKS